MRWEICGDRYFEMGRGLKKEKKSHVHKYLENNVVTDFFLIGIHSMQCRTATTRHMVTKKKGTKRLKHSGNLFRKNQQ